MGPGVLQPHKRGKSGTLVRVVVLWFDGDDAAVVATAVLGHSVLQLTHAGDDLCEFEPAVVRLLVEHRGELGLLRQYVELRLQVSLVGDLLVQRCVEDGSLCVACHQKRPQSQRSEGGSYLVRRKH